MASNERNETILFYLQLLSETINIEQYPFIKMVIDKQLTREEYEELMQFIKQLYDKYQTQKEAGFLDFTPILVQFAGMLNEKLDPDTTIYALKKENYFPELMGEFINILET